MTIFDCLQNIPANFRIKRNGLFAITIMNCNGYVHWMGNGQRYEHFLCGRILLDDFSFPRTPCERFVGEAVGGTASAARRCCNGLCTARMNSGCSETGGFPAMENALANEHLCIFFIFCSTYGRFSGFLKLVVIFERGLKADTSRYGELIWMLPRGAYTLPKRSGPLSPIVSLAFCTISVYRERSSCAWGSNLNCVSVSLSGVRKSKLNMSV